MENTNTHTAIMLVVMLALFIIHVGFAYYWTKYWSRFTKEGVHLSTTATLRIIQSVLNRLFRKRTLTCFSAMPKGVAGVSSSGEGSKKLVSVSGIPIF